MINNINYVTLLYINNITNEKYLYKYYIYPPKCHNYSREITIFKEEEFFLIERKTNTKYYIKFSEYPIENSISKINGKENISINNSMEVKDENVSFSFISTNINLGRSFEIIYEVSIEETYSAICQLSLTIKPCYKSCKTCTKNNDESNNQNHNCIKCDNDRGYFSFPEESSNYYTKYEMAINHPDWHLDKENKIQIGKDNNNNSDKDIKSQMRKNDDIILEKENININNIDLNNNQIKEKISDNFNLLDSDNIKKININSDSFLNYQSNNSIKKIDSNILRNIDSSEINLIKFDKNNSNSLIFEENKEIEEDEFNKNIENIISSNIDNIKDDIIHSILLESSKIQQKTKINKMNPKNNYIHKNYECDVCKIHPIKGIRYHCLECKDFDLCEKCEEKVNHEHPLYKIKNEKLCKFKN